MSVNYLIVVQFELERIIVQTLIIVDLLNFTRSYTTKLIDTK
jgi:hypothetical protein